MPKGRRNRKAQAGLSRGPFTAADFDRQLRRMGYERIPGKHKHWNYRHPSRPGKVSVASNWTGIRANDRIFNSIAAQTGYGKDLLLRVLNGLEP